MFSERRSRRRGAGEDNMMQASGEPCHNVGNLRAIWSRLPLFWRFQLAGWAAFVPLTFPLKVVLAGTIPGALLLSFIRDGSSFALTLGMRVIYRRFLNDQNRYRAIVPVVTVVCLTAGLLQTGFLLLFRDIFPLEKEVFFITSVEFSLFLRTNGPTRLLEPALCRHKANARWHAT